MRGKDLCVHGEDAKRLLAYSPKRYKSVNISVNYNTNLKFFFIRTYYTIWDGLSQKTVSRYCLFKMNLLLNTLSTNYKNYRGGGAPVSSWTCCWTCAGSTGTSVAGGSSMRGRGGRPSAQGPAWSPAGQLRSYPLHPAHHTGIKIKGYSEPITAVIHKQLRTQQVLQARINFQCPDL